MGKFSDLNPVALPLPTLLSQVLVAFTIEFDNEFEHQMPHGTTTSKSTNKSETGPWLTSMAMWSNVMQYIPEAGVTVAELQELARVETLSLAGLERWGYIVIEPDRVETRRKPSQSNRIVRPTVMGRRAQAVWRPLFDVIEKRWELRFGKNEIDRLRQSLQLLIGQFDVDLPDYLPVVGYGLVSQIRPRNMRPIEARENSLLTSLNLPALLSKALLAIALEFERDADVSIAISANVVRVLNQSGVPVRDLPRLSGVSKESISMSLGYLEKGGYVVIGSDPAHDRTKLAKLSPKGQTAQNTYHSLIGEIEERWDKRYGEQSIYKLRTSLGYLVGEPSAQPSPLFQCLNPYPDGWRANIQQPETLPYFPMVLHRGGYPDGS